MLDGRPINDPVSSHGGVKWDLAPLENVERIEILKGKGALEYGDDASGGVVLVSTRKIRNFSGNWKSYAGNHRTQSHSANIRFVKGTAGGALSASYDDTDGYKTNNDKEKIRGGFKVEYSPGKTFETTLSADFFKEEKGLSGTPDYPTPDSRQESRMNAFSFLASLFSVNSKTYFNEGSKHNTDRSRYLDKTLRVREAGQEFNSSCSFGRWGKSRFGTAFEWGKASGDQMQDQDETALSFFATHALKPGKWPVTVSAGVRANTYSEFDNGVNPEVKAVWENDGWQVSLSYNRSNNTPSFHQRYNETSSTRPNPDLQMETADNYGLSVFKAVSSNLSFGATLFYNEIADRITYVRNEEGVGQYQNFGEVTYKGGDVSLNWKLRGNLSFKASYTYLEAKDEDTGYWITSKARHKADAEVFWAPAERLSLVLGGEYSSEVYTRSDNSKSVPGYALTDLRGEYRFDRFSIFGEIQNLTDKTYYYVDGILAPPLTWLAGVNWTY